jgi:ABC-type bacteriocin/lantibiotic exporter with double-glycine peptidase domain
MRQQAIDTESFSFKELKFVRPSLIPVIKLIVTMAILILISSGLGLIAPYFSKQLFDRGIISQNVSEIIRYGLLSLGTAILALGLGFASQILFTLASTRFSLNIKGRTLERLLNMPYEFFDKRKAGYLVSRVNEADGLAGLFSPSVFAFFASLIEGVGAVIIVFRLNVPIALILIPFMIAFYLVSRWMSRKLRASSNVLMENFAISSGSLQETVAGVADVKQLNIENKKSNEIRSLFEAVANNRIKQSVFMSSGSSILGIVNVFATVTVTILAGISIVEGQLSIGDYVAITMYALKILTPVQLFGNLSIMLQPILTSLGRLKLIFESKTEQEFWGDRKISNIKGEISFRDVSFGYDPEKGDVLKNCSFSISPGECIALYGANGTGKSTIFKLMLGFYPNYAGEIQIDGTELHQFEMSSLRQRVGIVSQNLFLFTGRLKDNIKMAAPEVSNDDIDRVLKMSGCMSVFNGEVENIHVMELGRNLSGGQRQAVAIARCMLKNPDVLLFDEVTAHLDMQTRQIVMNAIKEGFPDKTRILITQDRGTATIADRILLLEGGNIREIDKVAVL